MRAAAGGPSSLAPPTPYLLSPQVEPWDQLGPRCAHARTYALGHTTTASRKGRSAPERPQFGFRPSAWVVPTERQLSKDQDKDVKVLYTHQFLARHPKHLGSCGAKFHLDNCFAYFRKVVCVAWWGSGEEGEGRRHSINKQKYECQFLLIQGNIMSLLLCHSSIRNVGGL